MAAECRTRPCRSGLLGRSRSRTPVVATRTTAAREVMVKGRVRLGRGMRKVCVRIGCSTYPVRQCRNAGCEGHPGAEQPGAGQPCACVGEEQKDRPVPQVKPVRDDARVAQRPKRQPTRQLALG